MAKLRKFIRKTNIKTRALSLVLSVAVLASAILYFGNDKMENVSAEAATRTYMEYIIDRMVAGLQDNFKILEIVPYTGYGEFRYYVGEADVKEGLESRQDFLKEWYMTNCGGYITGDGTWSISDEWVNMQGAFANFGYEIKYNSYTDKFEVRCPEVFINKVVPEYADILGDRIEVATVEANDLTAEQIADADLIIVTTGTHDTLTKQCYDAYTGHSGDEFYDASGSSTSDGTYNSYEKVKKEDGTYEYVPRDASWEACEALLDYAINGRSLELSDGSVVNVKTPLVLDNKEFGAMDKSGNMYKFNLLYRMVAADRWNELKNYLSTSYTNEAGETVNYLTGAGLVTVALDTTATGTFDENTALTWDWGSGDNNPIVKLFSTLGNSGYSAYYDSNPPTSLLLTDDYWVYLGDSVIIPANTDREISAGNTELGFVDRTGKGNPTTVEILQYLLGAKASQIVKFNYTMKVLEVQPCNSFDYDTFEEALALGKRMLMSTTDSWTESNYKDYLDIDCVTTNALNGMTVDLISEYDMIIIGDNTDLLTKIDDKTIYNDRNLNGYIYLAFGDLMKLGNSLLGYLPTEYTKWNYSGSEKSYDNDWWNIKYGIVDSVSSTPRWSSYQYKQPIIDETQSSLTNQIRYDELFVLTDATKDVWNDYLFESDTLTHGDNVYVLKSMYNYYKSGGYFGITSYGEELYTKYSLGNTRLPDNDITDITKEKLLKYAEAGKLLVLADCVYDVDGSKLYPTSDMYDLAQTLAKAEKTDGSYDSIIRQKRIGAAYLHRDNVTPEIAMKEAPVSAEDSSSYDSDGFINAFCGRDITFKFDVTGQAGKTYKISLLIDKNGDGVFKKIESGILDDRNEVYFSDYISMPSSGVYSNYVIDSQLSDNFVGMLSWKIEVVQVESEGGLYKETAYSCEANGYSAVKNEGEAEEIRVLQILPYRQYFGGGNQTTLNLQTNTYFQSQLSKVAEKVGYNVIIETKYTYEYEAWFNPSGGVDNSYTKGTDINTEKDKLKNYDMIVLGFANLYDFDDVSNMYGAVDNILDFIDIGKAVLFTHDTLSYVATQNFVSVCNDSKELLSLKTEEGKLSDTGQWVNNDGNKNSVTLTRELREIVGMDKYGITLSEDDRDGKEVPVYDDAFELTYGNELGTNGLYYYDGTDYVRELQGFSSWALYRTSFLTSFAKNYDNGLSVIAPYANASYFGETSLWTTKEVVQLNKGQVTMYPFAIDETLEVAETHAQYYELDMEDEDVVVWYTLSGDDASDTLDTFYSDTEKDAGNNYYIYSKNNITYSGAGHKVMNSEMELKLFVNTIVKAIAGGNNTPDLVVTNGAKGNGDIYYIYSNSSESASEYELDIKATDADLISLEAANGNVALVGEFKEAKVYWVKNDGTEILIKDFDTSDPLKNGIVRELQLGDTSLSSSQLDEIEELVEGTDGGAGTYAQFRIYVSDWMGATDEITVRMVTRDLFNLD